MTPQPAHTLPPAVRIFRTVVQVLVAMSIAVPTATAALGFSATTAAKIAGIVGGAVIIVTALQNGLEKAGVLPTVTAVTGPPTATVTNHFTINSSSDPAEVADDVKWTPAAPLPNGQQIPSTTARKVALAGEKPKARTRKK